ncbi:MAG TPA: hypothetical protein V6D29_13005 [Leptolyngbyaceae cyanobacterium]
MKSYAPKPVSSVRSADVWLGLLGIVAATVFVGSTSVIWALGASAPGVDTPLPSEAGLWSAFGQKD